MGYFGRWSSAWGTAAAFSQIASQVVPWFPGWHRLFVEYKYWRKTGGLYNGGQVQGLTSNPDNSRRAAISTTGAKVIQIKSGQASEIGGVSPGLVNDMVFSPDGKQLLTANDVNQSVFAI